MIDPWEALRRSRKLWGNTADDYVIPVEKRLLDDLLSDADALLAVVRELEIDELDPGDVYFSATRVYNALAALPEHLREEA